MIKFQKLPIQHKQILQPFFEPLFFRTYFNLDKITICIMPKWFGTLGGRGTHTAAAVVGKHICVIPEVLICKKNQQIRNNYWSIDNDAKGIATWCHEVFHCYQFHEKPWRFVGQGILGIIYSLLYDKKLYNHKRFPYEQEAILFAEKVRNHIL